MTIDIIKNRIEAINIVRRYANNTVPLIRADIEKNSFNIKVSKNEFYEKDAERLKAFLKYPPENTTAHISISPYADPARLTLCIKIFYKTSEHTVSYYNENCSLNFYAFEPLKILNVAQMKKKHIQAYEMINKAKELNSLASKILYLTEGQ